MLYIFSIIFNNYVHLHLLDLNASGFFFTLLLNFINFKIKHKQFHGYLEVGTFPVTRPFSIGVSRTFPVPRLLPVGVDGTYPAPHPLAKHLLRLSQILLKPLLAKAPKH